MASEDKNEIDKQLQEALARVIAKEKMAISIELNQVKELKSDKTDLRSKQIYAKKEMDAVTCRASEDELLTINEEKVKVTNEILELNHASLNHKLIQSTLQRAAFNVKIQEVVYEELEQVDETDHVQSSPELQNLLGLHGNNIHTNKSLLELIEKKEKLDEEILTSRLQLQELYRNLKIKWQQVSSKEYAASPDEDKDTKSLRDKVEVRTSKLKIIMYIIQSLVSGSGVDWGASNFYLQLMLLCDQLLLKGMDTSQDDKLDAINMALEERKGLHSTSTARKSM